MVGKIICRGKGLTAIVLLNGHDAPVNPPSKHSCLHVSLPWSRQFVFAMSGITGLTDFVAGGPLLSPKWKKKILYLYHLLKGREGRTNVKAGRDEMCGILS